jgi:hypothetical protein
VVLDEAHSIKYEARLKSQTVFSLRARYHVLLTGTPVENRLTDLCGQLCLFRPDTIWEEMKVNRAKNPFRWEDTDERARLRATPYAIASFICNKKSRMKQGEMLGKGLYSHIP